jgi:HPt (histidine-containing phosphotransfer) domain-containing protein
MNIKEISETLGLEEEEYLELIELFIDTGVAEFDRLKSAFSGLDFEQMVSIAHMLKGAASNLGLTDVQSAASNIEQRASAQTQDGLGEAMQTLGQQFKNIEQIVRG